MTKRIRTKRIRKKPQRNLRREAYFKLRKILPSSVSLPLDGILCAATSAFHLDIFRLEKQIANYNGEECTYKGKPNYSMKKAINEEWGEEACKLIEFLI